MVLKKDTVGWLTAGIDVGSSTAKCVILEDTKLAASALIPTGPDSEETAEKVLKQTLAEGGWNTHDLKCIVATGYGRIKIPFAETEVSEISCHAKGVHLLNPEVRTILDMGGQDCKAIRCDDKGNVLNFVMNDKCAAGTGRFLERIARALDLELDEIGPLSLETVEGPIAMKSQCAVFAQREILYLLRLGKHKNDVLAGTFKAICRRMVSLLKTVGLEEPLYVSGGVAKNIGILKYLGDELNLTPQTTKEAQYAGAMGAALIAAEISEYSGLKV